MKKRIIAIVILLFFILSIIMVTISTNPIKVNYNKEIVKNNSVTAGITKDVVPDITDIIVEEDTVEEVGISPELKIGYATTATNVRSKPSMDSKIVGVIYINTEIEYELINGKDYDWCKFEYDGNQAYIRSDLISEDPVEIIVESAVKKQNYNSVKQDEQTVNTNNVTNYSGSVLTKSSGIAYGPSGRETYYNLDMSNCIRYMKDLGYDYNYWVDNRGIKRYGNWIMVAANTNVYPKGTVIPTSLGMGMVCDHCEAAEWGISSIDIAVTW